VPVISLSPVADLDNITHSAYISRKGEVNGMTLSNDIQKFLQALSNPNRQRIMLLFAEQPVLTVGDVASRTDLGMSTVSEHLKQLREAGLLNAEKVGKEVEYRVNVARIQDLLNQLNGFLGQCC
jgi:DNA-binding transcriptional ArsR family regulator